MLDPRDRQTVWDVLDERVARLGDKTWLVTETGRYSFVQMQQRGLALAHGFTAENCALLRGLLGPAKDRS